MKKSGEQILKILIINVLTFSFSAVLSYTLRISLHKVIFLLVNLYVFKETLTLREKSEMKVIVS
jgi:hypothetical protein